MSVHHPENHLHFFHFIAPPPLKLGHKKLVWLAELIDLIEKTAKGVVAFEGSNPSLSAISTYINQLVNSWVSKIFQVPTHRVRRLFR